MTQLKAQKRRGPRKAWVVGVTLPAFLLASGLAFSEVRSDVDTRGEEYSEPRTVAEVITDGWITTKVKSRLFADRAVSGFGISVETRDKVVYLSGEVHNEAQGSHAIRIVRETEGVEHVDATALRIATEVDQVRLATGDPRGDTYRDEYRDEYRDHPEYPGPRDSTEDAGDDLITVEVQSRLFADPQVSGYDIAVETRNKVVYLSGEVENQSQVDQAVRIARNTRGVARVDATALRAAGQVRGT